MIVQTLNAAPRLWKRSICWKDLLWETISLSDTDAPQHKHGPAETPLELTQYSTGYARRGRLWTKYLQRYKEGTGGSVKHRIRTYTGGSITISTDHSATATMASLMRSWATVEKIPLRKVYSWRVVNHYGGCYFSDANETRRWMMTESGFPRLGGFPFDAILVARMAPRVYSRCSSLGRFRSRLAV